MSNKKFNARHGVSVGTTPVDVIDDTGAVLTNAATATKLLNSRTISISGDVVATGSFDGSGNLDLAATIQANSVALGTDTTGNYMVNVSAGTGVSVSHTPGEGSTATVSIGQAVGTSDNVSFNNLTLAGELRGPATFVIDPSAVGDNTGKVVIKGDLQVDGTTTTINSTSTTIDDVVLTLGGDTAPASDDTFDKGIEYRWYDTQARMGFFGFDRSTGKLTFIPQSTLSSGVYSGTTGEIDAKLDWSNVLNKPTIDNTTYNQLAVTTTGGALLRLNSSSAVNDDIKLASGTNVTVAYTNDNTITISSSYTDTNTTYSVKASAQTGGAGIDLDAGGSGSGTDTVKILGSGGTLVTRTDADTITISSTSVGAGTLSVATKTAGASSTDVTLELSGAYDANTSSNRTIKAVVGPSLTSLATLMTGATTGFIKKTSADTYTLDTNTYLTTYTDTNTTYTLDGQGTTNDVDIQLIAGGSGTGTDSVKFVGAGATTVAWDETNQKVTITSTDTQPNDGALSVSARSAGTSGTDVHLELSGAYSANTSTNRTIKAIVGPALTNLATLMSTAGPGFIRRTASADTYSIDTNTYLTGNQSISLTGDTTGSGATSIATTTNYITGSDDRTKAPNDDTTNKMRFGFTSWTNNGNSPYADYLHLRSYTDATGGNDNLVMFRKDAIGMRIWQQTWGSTTAYATYKDVAFTDQIPTVNNGALSVATKTAGATNTDVTLELSGAYSANTSTDRTIKAVVGPALTALSTFMTTATAGFIKRTGQDTYGIDTNTYLTSYSETDTLSSVTGRGATTSTNVTLSGGTTSLGHATLNTLTASTGSLTIKTADSATVDSKTMFISTGNTSAAGYATGNLTIRTGSSTGLSGGYAGDILIWPGNSDSTPAQTTIRGGASVSGNTTAGQRGDLNLTGGDNSSNVTSGTVAAGYIYILGGTVSNTSTNVTKYTGGVYISGGGSGAGGTINYGSINIGSLGQGTTYGTSAVNIGINGIVTTVNGTVKLPNVGTSGFVKLGAGGQLSADTNTYLTGTKVDSISATSPIVASASTGAVTLSHAASGVTAGTYNNVTVNATGHVTGGSNSSYLTAEADTLATVTGRGATTATTIVLTGGGSAAGSDANGVYGLQVQGANSYASLEIGVRNNYEAVLRSYGNDIHYFAGHWRTTATASEDHSHYWYTAKNGSTNWNTYKMRLDHNGQLTTTGNIGSTSTTVLNLATAGNTGTWIGAIQDGTSGWSLSGATIGFKSDNTTYAAIGLGSANGILYFGRTTASGVGTMSSWLEVDSGGVANFKRARPQHNGSNLALVSEIPTVSYPVTSVSGTAPITVSPTTGAVVVSHAVSGVTAGTYNNVTVNTLGHVTSGSNTAYLTSFTEADTLATVTGRGNTATGNILVPSGNGTGYCFWGDATNYKIAMANSSDYVYGPVTDYSIKLIMGAGAGRGITFGQAGVAPVAAINTTSGNMTIAGAFAAASKSFLIPHPTKEGWKLRYGSLEGPENGVYIRGKLKGKNKIELPEYWTKLVDPDSITVTLTPIGKHQKLYVEDISNNVVTVANDGLFAGEINCFFVVYGERVDIDKLVVEYE